MKNQKYIAIKTQTSTFLPPLSATSCSAKILSLPEQISVFKIDFNLPLICIKLIASVRVLFENKRSSAFAVKNDRSVRENFTGFADES